MDGLYIIRSGRLSVPFFIVIISFIKASVYYNDGNDFHNLWIIFKQTFRSLLSIALLLVAAQSKPKLPSIKDDSLDFEESPPSLSATETYFEEEKPPEYRSAKDWMICYSLAVTLIFSLVFLIYWINFKSKKYSNLYHLWL